MGALTKTTKILDLSPVKSAKVLVDFSHFFRTNSEIIHKIMVTFISRPSERIML